MAKSAEFTFNDANWQRIIKNIQKKWKDISNRKVYGTVIQAVVYKDILQHFHDERGPKGPWKEWSAGYAKWRNSNKGKSSGKPKILQLSGDLRKSIDPVNAKIRANSSGVLFYSNIEYAAKHDQGLDGMPERKFMYLSKDGFNELILVTERWLSEGL